MGWRGEPGYAVELFYRYLLCKAALYALVAPVAAVWSWYVPAVLILCAACALGTAGMVRRFA